MTANVYDVFVVVVVCFFDDTKSASICNHKKRSLQKVQDHRARRRGIDRRPCGTFM